MRPCLQSRETDEPSVRLELGRYAPSTGRRFHSARTPTETPSLRPVVAELQRVLPGISTEQLRSRLNRMVADGMLTRKRYREVPPRVDYELTERARELMPVLAELARWGYEWAWSPPRPSESVDLGAIFRLAPGLVDPSEATGTIELVVDEPDSRAAYTFSVSDDGVALQESESDRADARVHGTSGAWVRAFCPDRDRSGLEITGDHRLAEKLLDGLLASHARTADRTRKAA
jgi:HxlR-like helix-turn-helix